MLLETHFRMLGTKWTFFRQKNARIKRLQGKFSPQLCQTLPSCFGQQLSRHVVENMLCFTPCRDVKKWHGHRHHRHLRTVGEMVKFGKFLGSFIEGNVWKHETLDPTSFAKNRHTTHINKGQHREYNRKMNAINSATARGMS